MRQFIFENLNLPGYFICKNEFLRSFFFHIPVSAGINIPHKNSLVLCPLLAAGEDKE